MTISLAQASTSSDWRTARAMIEEYAASLGVDLCFQGFAEEMEHIADEYSPPRGALLLAKEGEAILGCVGLRPFHGDASVAGVAGDCEMKRMYVPPAGRGRGIGRRLAEAIVAEARSRGYSRMLLDTLPHLEAAQALYRSMGFVETAAYRHNPVPGALYFALDLRR